MQTKVIRTDGTLVPDGHCVRPDHNLGEFVIKIRSIAGVSASTLKNLLETRYEVVSIEQVSGTLIVQ